MYNYIFVTVGRVGSSTDLIEQKLEFVNDGEKRGFLIDLLQKQSAGVANSKVYGSFLFWIGIGWLAISCSETKKIIT